MAKGKAAGSNKRGAKGKTADAHKLGSAEDTRVDSAPAGEGSTNTAPETSDAVRAEEKDKAESTEIARARAGQAASVVEAKTTPQREIDEAKARAEEAAQVAATGQITVKFRSADGRPEERMFSRDAHGDKFMELADEFRRKHSSRIIKE